MINGFSLKLLGGTCMKKFHLESQEYKRVEKNLTLENFQIDKRLALKAIEIVNNGKELSPKMIKEVIQLGKI